MRKESGRASALWLLGFASASLALACSTTTGGTSSGSAAGEDGGTGPGSDTDAGDPKISACRGRSFDAPSDWSIPMPAAGTSWQQGYERYTLIDIHGDGKPDLVVTGTEKDTTLGKTKWLVFKNNGTSFENTPETWTLPMPAAGTSWQQGYERYTLIDIHGDGKPDLVITGTEKDTTVGKTKWLVFKNNGTSFESTPETWTLPMPAAGTSWQQGYERYTLIDIHGDGKPDLVITGTEKDKTLGDTKWLVFKNNGSSFETSAETWALPAKAPGTSWLMGSDRYALVDIHGDGKPDLVITGKTGDETLGQDHWDVYVNSGTAFEKNSETWPLARPAASVAWYTGDTRYALTDIHGDKRPDLVFTGLPNESDVGETKWIVQTNKCE
ncbi:MAG: VCBS repeat-containing protein [Polyangiaceae bacterium]